MLDVGMSLNRQFEQSSSVNNQSDSLDFSGQQQQIKSYSITYQVINKLLIKADESTEVSDDAPQLAVDTLEISSEAMTQLSIEQEINISLEITVEQEAQVDPLVLDLDGNGISTTGNANSINFDLKGDGTTSSMSNVVGNDAFLALDKNNNQRIDDGTELFGDQNGAANGFEELRKYDNNRDGKINAKDAVYDQLKLVRFIDGQQFMASLQSAGVSEISLSNERVNQQLNGNDVMAERGQFTYDDGRTAVVADLLLETS